MGIIDYLNNRNTVQNVPESTKNTITNDSKKPKVIWSTTNTAFVEMQNLHQEKSTVRNQLRQSQTIYME